MSDVTLILSAIHQGDPVAADHLLPLVYDELRSLAASRMAHESPDHTLQATALVHEAYLRLVDVGEAPLWNSRGHFFAAAAEAMRRILVENARRRKSAKRGGEWDRREIAGCQVAPPSRADDLLDLDEALDRLSQEDPLSAEIVKLRYFAGITLKQSAEFMGISPRRADFLWAYARAWLRRELDED